MTQREPECACPDCVRHFVAFFLTVKGDLAARKASEQRKCDGYGRDSLHKLTHINEKGHRSVPFW